MHCLRKSFGFCFYAKTAILDLHKPEDYNTRVVDYVKKYATEEALNGNSNGAGDNGGNESESSMSDFDPDGDEDEDFDMEM